MIPRGRGDAEIYNGVTTEHEVRCSSSRNISKWIERWYTYASTLILGEFRVVPVILAWRTQLCNGSHSKADHVPVLIVTQAGSMGFLKVGELLLMKPENPGLDVATCT